MPEVQEAIVARVPGTSGQTDKGPYNSTAALKSAVVDLYLLAASSHLLAPHYSSFPSWPPSWPMAGWRSRPAGHRRTPPSSGGR